MDLKALQQQSVKDIGEQFAALSDAQLRELHALESNAATPRKTLIENIDDELAQRAEQSNGGEAEAGGAGAAGSAAPAADPLPKWMDADYTGPITVEQAEWRNANLKPVEPVTKPVDATTK